MTFDPFYPPPVVPPTPPVSEPKRPLYGRVFAVVAIVFGVIFLLGGFIDGVALGFVALGVACILAGILYLKVKSGNGRKFWVVPAIAILPALIAAGLSAPAPEEAGTASEQGTTTTVTATTRPTTTSAKPTTTTAPPSTTTTLAPVPFVAPVTTTTEPPVDTPPPLVEAEPEYVPPVEEPEPEYVPPPPVDVPEAPSAVSYANCDAVRAAGAAPIYAGQPGYSFDLDRDRDGVACDT